MIFSFIDASSLVKRYAPEPGSTPVIHLFSRMPLNRLFVLSVGMAEVVSILVRKHNGKRITTSTFQLAMRSFRSMVSTTSGIRIVVVDGVVAQRAYDFIEQYSINSTDAILLRSALDLATTLRSVGDDLLLLASDQRLVKAGQAEGLSTLDPEVQSIADLDAILGP